MAKRAVKLLIIANLTVGTNAVVWAQDTNLGKSLYRLGCAVCHGIDGKGKGPLSEQLKVPPADLTVLAKKNNGVFPVSYVYEIIDGRKVIAAHGTREMPIWGAYDRQSLYPHDKLIDRSFDHEAVVRTRTLAIIDYLNRIQEKLRLRLLAIKSNSFMPAICPRRKRRRTFGVLA
jgi:hypothetical protein